MFGIEPICHLRDVCILPRICLWWETLIAHEGIGMAR